MISYPNQRPIPLLHFRRTFKNKYGNEIGNTGSAYAQHTYIIAIENIRKGVYLYTNPITRHMDKIFRQYFHINISTFMLENELSGKRFNKTLEITSDVIRFFFRHDILTVNTTIINRTKKGIFI